MNKSVQDVHVRLSYNNIILYELDVHKIPADNAVRKKRK